MPCQRALILAIFALAACQTGVGASGLRPQSGGSTRLHISGRAYLITPIQGAHVKATRLTSVPPEPLGETKTDEEGLFEFDFESVDGDILLEVIGDQGGNTIEPVTGTSPIPLSQDDWLATLVVATKLGETRSDAAINPWSTLVTARTLAEIRGGMGVRDAWQKNNGLFSAHFGTATPWNAPSIDLLGNAAPGVDSGTLYSLGVYSLSQHALMLGKRAGVTDVSIVNSLTLLRLLVADLHDRVFDGTDSGERLPSVKGRVFIDAETTRVSLAQSLEDFLGSTSNRSGLTARDLKKLLDAVRFDTSELYPPGHPNNQRDATAESGAPPAIVVLTPTADQILGTLGAVVGEVVDFDGVSSASVTIDGVAQSVVFDSSDPTRWRFNFTLDQADGSHLLEIRAIDALGNASARSIAFKTDVTGPAISFLACDAPDDRKRVVSVSVSGAAFSSDAPREGCTEAAIGNGTQTFHVFERMLSTEDALVPSVTLTITEPSVLASVTCQGRINGMPVGSPTACVETGAAPATHRFDVSTGLFGEAVVSVAETDTLSVAVLAKDDLGNETETVFAFRLHVLPTPLYIVDEPLDPGHALTSFNFANDTIASLFADSTFDVHLGQYRVTNVSGRDAVLSLAEIKTKLSGEYNLDSFHAFRDGNNRFSSGDGTSTGCPEGSLLRYSLGANNVVQSATCAPTVPTSFTRGSGRMELAVDVMELPSGTLVASTSRGLNDTSVLLAPNVAYRVRIWVLRGFVATIGGGAIGGQLASDDDGRACYRQYFSEGWGDASTGSAAKTGPFTRKNTFYVPSGGVEKKFYGYMSCNSTRNGTVGGNYCTGGMRCDDLTRSTCALGLCSVMGSLYARREAGSPGAVSRILGDVWFERRVRFNATGAWVPQIRLTTNNVLFEATADKSALDFVHAHVTEPPIPTLPADMDISLQGW